MSESAIAFKGVNKWFGKLHVLRDVSAEVAPGEVVVVCGPSGSGKSTLIRCVNALERVQGGEVVVLGEAITGAGVNLTRLRTQVGMVFQQFNLFPHMTALENVMEAPVTVLKLGKDEARERGVELLEMVGLSKHLDHKPPKLSGGQQQRVAIARAMAMRPTVMLFDEPTSALDPELIGEVLNVIRDLATSTDMTMLMVTHEMRFAEEISDRVVMFDQGSVVEMGAPGEIFKNPEQERTRKFLSAVLNR